jgi:hypothetical protein
MLGMHLAVGFAVAAEDLRHLQPGRHDGSSGRLSHLQLSRSSGLWVLPIVVVATRA